MFFSFKERKNKNIENVFKLLEYREIQWFVIFNINYQIVSVSKERIVKR
jgi:hypothetical protein